MAAKQLFTVYSGKDTLADSVPKSEAIKAIRSADPKYAVLWVWDMSDDTEHEFNCRIQSKPAIANMVQKWA